MMCITHTVFSRFSIKISVYTVNKSGKITPPCLTPLAPLKQSDTSWPHFTLISWVKQQLIKNIKYVSVTWDFFIFSKTHDLLQWRYPKLAPALSPHPNLYWSVQYTKFGYPGMHHSSILWPPLGSQNFLTPYILEPPLVVSSMGLGSSKLFWTEQFNVLCSEIWVWDWGTNRLPLWGDK